MCGCGLCLRRGWWGYWWDGVGSVVVGGASGHGGEDDEGDIEDDVGDDVGSDAKDVVGEVLGIYR